MLINVKKNFIHLQLKAIHNKDYSVVKTFKAASGSLFYVPKPYILKGISKFSSHSVPFGKLWHFLHAPHE